MWGLVGDIQTTCCVFQMSYWVECITSTPAYHTLFFKIVLCKNFLKKLVCYSSFEEVNSLAQDSYLCTGKSIESYVFIFSQQKFIRTLSCKGRSWCLCDITCEITPVCSRIITLLAHWLGYACSLHDFIGKVRINMAKCHSLRMSSKSWRHKTCFH